MNRIIRSVAVVGSGVMGSRIACYFASTGVQVLLLDVLPPATASAHTNGKVGRNSIAETALAAALKSKPSPVFTKEVAERITTGNIEDDLPKIASCDWIIEAIVEKLEIKQQLFDKIENLRRAGTLVTTNTSGIPIHLMSEGRSDDFQQHFCGTHFFNPPRYLRLLEIIPAPRTKPDVLEFLQDYGSRHLGKTTVLCKDTPAFIANRVGVFAFMAVFKAMEQLALTIDEVDSLTGTILGHPKSATFRTADVVGLDTLALVARQLPQNAPDDEAKDIFALPAFIEKMLENKWLGDKTGQGFYKKVKGVASEMGAPKPNPADATFVQSPESRGDEHKTQPLAEPAAPKKPKAEILTLDLATMEYGQPRKTKFATIDRAKQTDDLAQRLTILYNGTDKAGEFYRLFFHLLFAYVSHRVPQTADELYKIDDALKAGFGWEAGPFETWDILGVEQVATDMKRTGHDVSQWVDTMLASGHATFYHFIDGQRHYYDLQAGAYNLVPGGNSFIILERLDSKIVWQNTACKLYDIGDEVLALEWKTKMNTIGGEVLEGVTKSVALAENGFKGLVIANSGPNFSAGANIGLIFMFAAEQDFDELDMAVRSFQAATMRLRYSGVPVVVAPHGLTLGGGCEMCLHADAVQAAAETYIGLVEVGVGLIPGGGGTKEMALRAAQRNIKEDIEVNYLQQLFINVGTAKVSTSGPEAFDNFILRKGIDGISINPDRRIADAKRKAISLWEAGYTQPVSPKQIKVQGRGGMGGLLTGVHAMWRGNYISTYDKFVAEKLAYVMCGGDLTQSGFVTEQYLLDLEREAFLSLCGERKTLERLQSILQTGKPLRN